MGGGGVVALVVVVVRLQPNDGGALGSTSTSRRTAQLVDKFACAPRIEVRMTRAASSRSRTSGIARE
jgi:hypothetical protein